MDYGSSTLYFTNQNFGYSSTSLYQGSNYVGGMGLSPTRFNFSSEMLNPPSLYYQEGAVTNYGEMPSMMFIGDFDGYWVHRVYLDGNLIMVLKTDNQQLFVPIAYDYIQSVCLSISPDPESVRGVAADPVVPAPAAIALFGLSAILARKPRNRFR